MPAVAAPDLPVFLTAYDPSDLPGGSVDPLGFDRGYLLLADKILPGLTNAASQPRYLSVLCAGASLSKVDEADPPRRQYQKRLECLLRFERFWALANVLASEQAPEGALPVGGVRGVTYALARSAALRRTSARSASADFAFLLRQVPYGVIGLYGAVADGMRLVNRKTLVPVPDLGGRLAEDFLGATKTPTVLRRAVQEDGDVPITTLTEWGERAHLARPPMPEERGPIRDALLRDTVRARIAKVLAAHPFGDEAEDEQHRLRRILPALEGDDQNADLRDAVVCILAFESCYRLALLGFERLLWRCRQQPASAVRVSDLDADPVLQLVASQLPAAVIKLGRSLDTARSQLFRAGIERIVDVRHFLELAAAACGAIKVLVGQLLVRHAEVQRGKFDRGRRKMPWIEGSDGRVSLNMTRVGGLEKEAREAKHITNHPYRLAAMDAFISVAGRP